MKILFSILSLLLSCTSFAQGELDLQKKVFYRNERTLAVLLNTNGFGANFRYAKRIDAFRKTLYEAEVNWLKHYKEDRISIEGTNRTIIYGKLNATYTLKGSIGFQKELFQKRDRGGISVRYFINGGPTFAILKPIYYEYYKNNDSTFYGRYLSQNHYFIAGKAPFTKGLDEISIRPGIYTKFGFTFEFSKTDKVIRALEIGASIDFYFKRVPIMGTPAQKFLFVLPDDQFFPNLYLSYRFGKVIDTRFSPEKNSIDRLMPPL